MTQLVYDIYVCPKDKRIAIVNPKATTNIAWALNCGECCECKERAEYYGKGSGKFNFPKGRTIRIDKIKELWMKRFSRNSVFNKYNLPKINKEDK